VVLVKEEKGWLAFFCTDVHVSAAAVLETMADRGAIEQTFKDVKEVWGAQQQQLRNIYACIGAFNVNLWMYSMVEAWAWSADAGDLVDRSVSPWATSRGDLRMPTNARRCKKRSCREKSRPLWPVGRPRGISARCPSVCLRWLPEAPVRMEP